MSAFIKQKLKQARDALGKKEYAVAEDAAKDVLDYEKDNYNALVFRGLALLNLERFDESEDSYLRATEVQPSQPLAWQGLEKFYESRKQWDKLGTIFEKQMDMFAASEDATKTAEVLQKYITLRREHGSKEEVIAALRLLLPSSFWSPLLSTLPAPDQTNPNSTTTFTVQMAIHVDSLSILLEVVQLQEKLEEEAVDKEVQRRRMRLDGAGKSKEQIRREVGREVWSASALPELWNEVLNHPSASDELRRSTESKLLRHSYQLFVALPPASTSNVQEKGEKGSTAKQPRKAEVLESLQALSRGMVILNLPDELAWIIQLEWQDCENLDDYPQDTLRRFVDIFPDSGRSKAINAYFRAFGVDQQVATDGEKEDDVTAKTAVEDQELEAETDPLDVSIDGLKQAPDSLLAQRTVSELYLRDGDWANAVDVSREALRTIAKLERETGLDFSRSKQGLTTTLCTSLVHLHPPQHHVEAKQLAELILSRSPRHVKALLATGYINEAAKRWEEALESFRQVAELDGSLSLDERFPSQLPPGLEARGEIAWCHMMAGRIDESQIQLDDLSRLLDNLSPDGLKDQRAKTWWRLGRCWWERRAEDPAHSAESYTCFIAALKRSPSFAPAFTSLGVYYLEAVSPPDHARASKCFQKAFELDAREDEAARRLAEGFAEDREWDLVEVVARRVVEGEGGGNVLGKPKSSGRYLSKNAWAWKAIGAVELTRGNVTSAIQAFQIALRADPDDATSWMRLGEAYVKSGRQMAALKALTRAEELAPDDWLVKYSIADVQKQLGLFDRATAILERILADRPDELGLRVELASARLAQAEDEFRTGYVGRSEASLAVALAQASKALRSNKDLRSAWKIVGDACFMLSNFGTLKEQTAFTTAIGELLGLLDKGDVDSRLGFSRFKADSGVGALFFSDAAVQVFKYRVLITMDEATTAAPAWHDLSSALFQIRQQFLKSPGREADAGVALRQAMRSIKQALVLEPRNDALWLTLGNLTYDSSARLSQHAYIKAIECNPKSPVPWTSLGFLYMDNGDERLSNEAFLKAQVLDPEWAPAWTGQALLARKNGDMAESRALFEHAFQLSGGAVLEADYGFATSTLSMFDRTTRVPPSSLLHAPSFALTAYLARSPDDPTVLHLSALLCERLAQADLAEGRLAKATALLEQKYEATEDPDTAFKYAVANSNLGRVRLSMGNLSGAMEAFETVLSLVEPHGSSDGETPSTSVSAALRLQAHFCSGIAHYGSGAPDGYQRALESFQAAIDEMEQTTTTTSTAMSRDSRAHVAVLLAQVLWAMGGEEQREAAKNQLLECIAQDPDCLPAITALAAIGIVSSDEQLVEAALSEIQNLSVEDKTTLDPAHDVDHLVAMHLFKKNAPAEAVSKLAHVVRVLPMQSQARLALAAALIQSASASSSVGGGGGSEAGEEEDAEEKLAMARKMALAVVEAATISTSAATTTMDETGRAERGDAWRLAGIAAALSSSLSLSSSRGGATEKEKEEKEGDVVGEPVLAAEAADEMDGKAAENSGGEGLLRRRRPRPRPSLAEAVRCTQRAVHTSPWEVSNWEALGFAALSAPAPALA